MLNVKKECKIPNVKCEKSKVKCQITNVLKYGLAHLLYTDVQYFSFVTLMKPMEVECKIL